MKSIRFNFVDYSICFIIIVVAFLFVFRFSDKIKQFVLSEMGNSEIIITVRTLPFKKEYSDDFIVGQPVINYDNNAIIGKLSDIAIYDMTDTDESSSNYVYAVLVIDSNIVKKGNHYMLNGDIILINEITDFAQKGVFFEGEILSMEASPKSKSLSIKEEIIR